MHYETIKTQMKIAELLHNRCLDTGTLGSHDLESCRIKRTWVVVSAGFLGKLMPTIVEEIVSQVREDERAKVIAEHEQMERQARVSLEIAERAQDRRTEIRTERDACRRKAEQARELLHEAWGVIANAENFKHTLRCDASHCVEGDHILDLDSPVPIGPQEWRDAAYRWRDRFHAAIDADHGIGLDGKCNACDATPAAAPQATCSCKWSPVRGRIYCDACDTAPEPWPLSVSCPVPGCDAPERVWCTVGVSRIGHVHDERRAKAAGAGTSTGHCGLCGSEDCPGKPGEGCTPGPFESVGSDAGAGDGEQDNESLFESYRLPGGTMSQSIPVTDPEHDAPDGVVVDGYTRRRNTWERNPVAAPDADSAVKAAAMKEPDRIIPPMRLDELEQICRDARAAGSGETPDGEVILA